MQKTTLFLMFCGKNRGKAKEAIDFYTSLFPNSEIKHIEYFSEDNNFGGRPGDVKHAIFTIAGQEYMALDAMNDQDHSFNPSMSILVHCESEEELTILYSRLTENGSVIMPIGYYGFGKKYGWVSDKFGISWQVDYR